MRRMRKLLIFYERHPFWDNVRERFSTPEERQFLWEYFEPDIKKTWDRLTQKVKEVMSRLDPKKVKLYVDSFMYWDPRDTPKLAKNLGEYPLMKKSNKKLQLAPAFEYLLKILPPKNFIGPEDYGLLELEDSLEKKLEKLKKVTDVKSISEELTKLTIRARDIHIANVINQTLQEGEIGLLFIGVKHGPQRFLSPEIKYEIVFGKEEWPEEKKLLERWRFPRSPRTEKRSLRRVPSARGGRGTAPAGQGP
jgi:hypothetical protein